MGEVVKFASSPVAIRRRLNELQRVLNTRNESIDSLLNKVHEESLHGAAAQTLYDDLIRDYIEKFGIDNISLGDLEYSSDLGLKISSDGQITVAPPADYIVGSVSGLGIVNSLQDVFAQVDEHWIE